LNLWKLDYKITNKSGLTSTGSDYFVSPHNQVDAMLEQLKNEGIKTIECTNAVKTGTAILITDETTGK